MAGFDLVVRGGTIVSGAGRRLGDIGVRDGKIVAVAEDLGTDAERVIDATGCYLLPGIVDAHVHPIHAETIGTTSEAAAFGGVTTLLHFIYLRPERGMVESLRAAREEGEAGSLVDFGLHATVTDAPRRMSEFRETIDFGVRSFKFFMAYQKRGMLTTDRELLDAMEVLAAMGGLAMVHAENGAITDSLEERYRAEGRVAPTDYPPTRPPIAESEATHRALALARVAGCPLYIVHISCKEALDEVVRARAGGQKGVYAETCPHYLTLTADDAMPRFGARAKIAPPLRSPGDVEALWAGIADGTIDTVASDHSAFSPEEKHSADGNVFDVGFGAPGVESLLTVTHDAGVNGGRIGLERLVELLAEAPARIFRLPGKGSVAPGFDADLVVFDPNATRELSDSDLHGKAYYSLYSGRTVKGVPRMVIQRGQVIVDDRQLLAKPGQGKFIAAGREG